MKENWINQYREEFNQMRPSNKSMDELKQKGKKYEKVQQSTTDSRKYKTSLKKQSWKGTVVAVVASIAVLIFVGGAMVYINKDQFGKENQTQGKIVPSQSPLVTQTTVPSQTSKPSMTPEPSQTSEPTTIPVTKVYNKDNVRMDEGKIIGNNQAYCISGKVTAIDKSQVSIESSGETYQFTIPEAGEGTKYKDNIVVGQYADVILAESIYRMENNKAKASAIYPYEQEEDLLLSNVKYYNAIVENGCEEGYPEGALYIRLVNGEWTYYYNIENMVVRCNAKEFDESNEGVITVTIDNGTTTKEYQWERFNIVFHDEGLNAWIGDFVKNGKKQLVLRTPYETETSASYDIKIIDMDTLQEYQVESSETAIPRLLKENVKALEGVDVSEIGECAITGTYVQKESDEKGSTMTVNFNVNTERIKQLDKSELFISTMLEYQNGTFVYRYIEEQAEVD